MKRPLEAQIIKDLAKKMVFLVGPRQAGKTWLAKKVSQHYKRSVYLNYDNVQDKKMIKKQNWLPSTDLLILDELHKMRGWKNYLKGLYDTKPEGMHILVTGSARLDVFHRMGDSLAGRFFMHRLLPFSLAEVKESPFGYDLPRFLERGGFPEPFLTEDPLDAKRWRQQYIHSLIRTDIFDIEIIHNLKALESVLEILRHRVGSPVSYQSIAEDVGISPTTVKKYIQLLEALFIIFRVTPFSKNIARSLLKEPKIYFFDTGMIEATDGARLENFAAISLLKWIYHQNDCLGSEYKLHYLRTKDGREVDFAVANKKIIEHIIEVKQSDLHVHSALAYFHEKNALKAIQVVQHCRTAHLSGDIEIVPFIDYFRELSEA
ncbi:MAG: ATP-binding protein [Gammaproteobacteria bacterium]